MERGRIHNKQFVISDSELTWDVEEWLPEEHSVFGKFRIYYDRNLHIKFGKNGVLIGDAFQGDLQKQSCKNPEEILDMDILDVSEEYESWNGRWVLVYKNQIHLDATSLLGVFYGKIDEERWAVSSSLALLSKVLNGKLMREEWLPSDVACNHSLLHWNPGPRTVLKGIRRLLPTQLLYLEKNGIQIEYRDTINKRSFAEFAPEEIYELIYEQQINVLKIVAEKYKKINLGLTAGYDSRLLCAVMAKGNIPFSCHSFQCAIKTADDDKEIAAMIAEKLGLEYKYILLDHNVDAGRVIDYVRHTFHNLKHFDYKCFYSRHQYDQLENGVYMRGGLYESFSNYYEKWKFKCTYEDSVDFMMKQLGRLFVILDGNPCAEASLKEYCQWVKQHPTKNMTFVDMLTYEQQFGCWLNDTSQGMDLTWDGLFINPLNSMRIFSLIAGLPREKRDHKVWEAEMTKMLCPEIADFPYHPTPF